MEFNTQVCTTREQSERLLALGLKGETADCHWCYHRVTATWYVVAHNYDGIGGYVPAWSLHRLLEICPDVIYADPALYKTVAGGSIFYRDDEDNEENEIPFSEFVGLYDNVVACIEWLMKCGYVDKEYVEG